MACAAPALLLICATVCESGGIGRRTGLRIQRPGHAGSSPASRTSFASERAVTFPERDRSFLFSLRQKPRCAVEHVKLCSRWPGRRCAAALEMDQVKIYFHASDKHGGNRLVQLPQLWTRKSSHFFLSFLFCHTAGQREDDKFFHLLYLYYILCKGNFLT